MKRIKAWHCDSWDEYLHWHEHDDDKWEKVNELLKDIERNPFKGLGKPEPLKHIPGGWWSRRITDEHRIVYRVRDEGADRYLDILRCRGHYK